MIKFIRVFQIIVLAIVAWLPTCVVAQQKIELLDVLNPYRLSATLLDNGDFTLRTQYGSAVPKHIIYQQDGTSTKPVNYTSHIHFKVDNTVFQLPFEEDTATLLSPPPHPLTITSLFADTVGGIPRINAAMFGILPDGDSIRFIFTMEPSRRPGGGFIKLSAKVRNTTSKLRNVGALFFIDTQIDTNDAAPIATAYGYSDLETDFSKSIAPGIPEFWLALEGTPQNPLLTARGNLVGPGLIKPDYLIFGNWTDFGANPVIKGLNYVLWNERGASHKKYKDSGILLRWEQGPLGKDAVEVIAATEIGVIDSLKVTKGSGGGGGGGGGLGSGIFSAGTGGCSALSLNQEIPCGVANYSPYVPDSLQLLYLVSNTNPQSMTQVEIDVPNLPAGLISPKNPSPFIPNSLDQGITGVGTFSIYAVPRLYDTTFNIPVRITSTSTTAIVYDTICLFVPGILPTITIDNAQFAPLCPGNYDTVSVNVHVKGVRCLPFDSVQILSGGKPADVKRFRVLRPLPSPIPPDGITMFRVEYNPDVLDTQRVKIVTFTHEYQSLNGKDTTFIAIRDTSLVTGIGKDAEFFLANKTDTLDFGKLCLGDTLSSDWPILNKGGCELVIDNAKIIGGKPGQFVLQNGSKFPLTIPRAVKGSAGRATIKFSPHFTGTDYAKLVVSSIARPLSDTLILRGTGDSPRYSLSADTVRFDTICPGRATTLGITLMDSSVCTADIDSITIASTEVGFSVQPASGFSIAGKGTASPQIGANFTTLGPHKGTATIHSKLGDRTVELRAITATRSLTVGVPVDYQNILLGQTKTQTITITSSGTAPIVLQDIQIAGAQSADFSFVPSKPAMPLTIAAGSSFSFQMSATPSALNERFAQLIFAVDPTKSCDQPLPLSLRARGIQPLIDVPQKLVDLGRVCAGDTIRAALTLHNPGNAPLSISSIATSGTGDISIIDNTPFVVDSNATRQLVVKYIPSRLGPQTLNLRFSSNGKWATAPDTAVTLQGTGILCGTISVDTVRGTVGTTVAVPVRFTPNNAAVRAADVMNVSGMQASDFSISHNPKIVRFNSTVSDGYLFGSSAVVTPSPSQVQIRVAPGTMLTPVSTNIVATLHADLLLGDDFQSPLDLHVTNFAEGYSKLDVRQGLVLEEGCALDHRYITSSSKGFIAPKTMPLAKNGQIAIGIEMDAAVEVDLFDLVGRPVSRLLEGDLKKGEYTLQLPANLVSSGVYIVRMKYAGEAISSVILVQ